MMEAYPPNPFDTKTHEAPEREPYPMPPPYAPPPAPPLYSPPAPPPTPDSDVAKVDPTMIDMTSDQTVEGRSAGIIAKNSPLMQLAETRALQQANARGLLNSSMAVGAGQTAVLDKATDIAKSDASTAAQTAQLNANAANTAKGLNAAAINQFGLVDKNTQADLAKMGAAQTFDLAKLDRQSQNLIAQMTEQQKNDIATLAVKQGYTIATLDDQQVADLAKIAVEIEAQDKLADQKYGYDTALLNIQKESNREIAALEAQYKNLTQASASATAIINSVSTNVARIMENTTLDAAAKQLAIDTYSSNANKALQMIGAISGDVDLAAFFDEVLNGVIVDGTTGGDGGGSGGGGGSSGGGA